jgi:hypothetical protein
MEICNGRMMGSMFAKDLSAVGELTLEGFSQNWIERFVLACANVQRAQRECYHLLQSLKVITRASCLRKEFRRKAPNIYYSLNGRTRFKDFDR